MANPRRHHYIPQCYLKNFCLAGSNKIWTLKKSSFSSFETHTKNVAVERDFLKLEGTEPEDAYSLEKEMANLEGKVSPVIGTCIQKKKLPSDEDLSLILAFIAFTATKIPQKRKVWGDFMGDIADKVMSLLLADKTRWESALSRMEEDGQQVDRSVTFEEMQTAHLQKKFKLVPTQAAHIDFFMKGAEVLGDLLPRRNWSVFYTDQSAEFVTSDNPVVLTWHKPVGAAISPGFGLMGTAVHFPLSPDTLLVGTFEPLPPENQVGRDFIASANSLTLLYSDDFIFSKSKEFFCYRSAGIIESSADIVMRAKRESKT